MSQPRARGGVPAFAGLRSFMSGGRRAGTDDQPEEDREEDEPEKDPEGRKAERAEEDEKRKEEDARRAEEDDRRKDEDARRAEEDSDDSDDENKNPKDGKKGKVRKAKGDQPDDEECEEEDDPDAKVAAAARAGRLAERARWVNALNDPGAAANAASACVMLASTEMHSSGVIAAVKALPSQARTGRTRLDERMDRVRTPHLPADGGAPADPNSAEGKAAAIILAGKKRRGEA